MLTEIQQESLTGPTAYRFDNIKGNSSEEVFEGGANANSMPFERFDAQVECGKVDSLEELISGERTNAIWMLPGEECLIVRGVIHCKVIGQGSLRVKGAFLSSPENVLAGD